MAGFAEFSSYDAVGLAGLVHNGDVRPIELVEEVFRRIEHINPRINAVVTLLHDAAEKAARRPPIGPFGGVPILLKDAFYECAGVPLTNGSKFYKGYIPDFDAEFVGRIKRAGLIIVGKTNVPEFALMPFTEPELFGPCRNPWDPERTTGGSSGGAAASVASRIAPMAQASDGGGSIRIPASCCAVFGLKPTRARTPTGPSDIDSLHGAVVGHAVTLSVRDSAALLDVLAGAEPGAVSYPPPRKQPYLTEVDIDPGCLRIGYTAAPFLGRDVDPECVAALERTVTLLQELGHKVEEIALKLDRDKLLSAVLVIAASWVAADIREAEIRLGRKVRSRDFETETWLLALLGRHYRGNEYVQAFRTIRKSGLALACLFEGYEMLLTPTLAMPPVPLGWGKAPSIEEFAERLEAAVGLPPAGALHGLAKSRLRKILDFTPYTPLFNLTGHPAMSVPLEWSSTGLPIGLHFAGRYGDEATLFRLAGQLERARPWRDQLPTLHA